MKTESIFLLIHLVSLTLAAVVPAVDDKVSDVADKKDVITSTESVESAESIESLGSNDPKVTSNSPIEKNEENESAESTDSPALDNDVLKTSSTFHRRYHYPSYPQYYRRPVAYGYYNRYPQYYRRPVASGYYNRYPQYYRPPVASGHYNRYPEEHSVNHYSYNRPPLPNNYTQPTYLSQHSYSESDSGSSGGDSAYHPPLIID